MSEIKKSVKKWHIVKLNPPSKLQCKKFAHFMRHQKKNPSGYPLEKDSIPDWKLRKNKTNKGFLSLMITNKEKKIISSCSVTPKKIWDGENLLLGGEIGDTFTDKEFQRKGMFKNLVHATTEISQNSGLDIIYGLPNHLSLPGYLKKLNFKIKENIYLQSCTLILNTKILVKKLKRDNDNYIYNRIKNIIFSFLSISQIWHFILKLSTKNLINVNLEIKFENTFTEDYNLLWEEVRNGIFFAHVRDSSYLNWRFCDSPFDFKILSVRKKGILKGYLIFLIDPNQNKNKIRRLQIIDWIFNPVDFKSVGVSLLKTVVKFSLANNIDVISSYRSENSPIQLPWNRFGFIHSSRSKPMIIHNNKIGSKIIDNQIAWHFTLADTDAF